MKRVRYGKVDESGIKTSVSTLTAKDGAELQVLVDTFNNNFKVVTLPEGFTALEGTAKSYQLVLRKVKLALDELGVGLTKESRGIKDLGFSGHTHNGPSVEGIVVNASTLK